jgi:riboflavin biosynthesis pyrimidine reductase
MTDLAPLESLYEVSGERITLPLPAALSTLYGPLQFPEHAGRSYGIGNLVETLDGVVSLNVPGRLGGNVISGSNQHDRLVMGLLRAVADVIVVGAGTLRAAPDHLWTAQFIYPPLAESYQVLRTALGKATPPVTVVVTASGKVDLSQRTFKSGEVQVLLVTTAKGAEQLSKSAVPPSVHIATVAGEDEIGGRVVVNAIRDFRATDLTLVEGGPHLLGSLLADQCLDELFLTLSPQIAGRDDSVKRISLVEGQAFGPENPLWGKLAGLKRGDSHLFLRYAFEAKA